MEWLETKADTEELRKDTLDILQKIHVPEKILKDVIRVYGICRHWIILDYI